MVPYNIIYISICKCSFINFDHYNTATFSPSITHQVN